MADTHEPQEPSSTKEVEDRPRDKKIKLSWDPNSIGGTGIPTWGPAVDRRRAAYKWLSSLELKR